MGPGLDAQLTLTAAKTSALCRRCKIIREKKGKRLFTFTIQPTSMFNFRS